MKRLARSSLSDKHCTKCDTLLVSNTYRYINGSMHECAVCPKESKLDNEGEEIVRLQNLIKSLEGELHECCMDVLAVIDVADKVSARDQNAQSVCIAVNDACSDVYHKYDYRVRGYDADSIIHGSI